MKISTLRWTVSILSLAAAACGETKTEGIEGGFEALEIRSEFAAVPLGQSTQWEAFGKRADGSEQKLTDQVTWSTSNQDVAQMSEQTDQHGWLITVGEGFTAVAATYETLSTSLRFEVTAPIVEAVELGPTGMIIGLGKSIALEAVARRTDDSRVDATADVSWSSSDEAVGRVSATDAGRFVAFGKGVSTVTATLDGLSASVMVSVTDATVERIILKPSTPRLETGSSLRMSADGVYSDQSTQDISRQVSWAVSDNEILEVSAEGVVTAFATGRAEVSATYDGVVAKTEIRAWTPGECNYPDAGEGIEYGETLPRMYWEDALTADGTKIDFRTETFACAEQFRNYETLLFVVSAAWCPNCPAFKRFVNDQADALEEAGMMIVYMEIETRSRQPASNEQAKAVIDATIENGPGLRIGDGDTKPLSQPFGRAVTAVPTAYVVRKADMKVIADQMRGAGYLPLLTIAQNPERDY